MLRAGCSSEAARLSDESDLATHAAVASHPSRSEVVDQGAPRRQALPIGVAPWIMMERSRRPARRNSARLPGGTGLGRGRWMSGPWKPLRAAMMGCDLVEAPLSAP